MVGYYQGDIIPSPDVVMVFGSNPEGRHGAGAAKVAREKFGAVYGVGEGLTGNAYALPTKDLRVKENNGYRSISPEAITESIKKLYRVAEKNPDKNFCVAYRNTGQRSLNGYTGYEMMDMFLAAGEIPVNVIFSKEWADTGRLGVPILDRETFYAAVERYNSGNETEAEKAERQAKGIYTAKECNELYIDERKILGLIGSLRTSVSYPYLCYLSEDIFVQEGGSVPNLREADHVELEDSTAPRLRKANYLVLDYALADNVTEVNTLTIDRWSSADGVKKVDELELSGWKAPNIIQARKALLTEGAIAEGLKIVDELELQDGSEADNVIKARKVTLLNSSAPNLAEVDELILLTNGKADKITEARFVEYRQGASANSLLFADTFLLCDTIFPRDVKVKHLILDGPHAIVPHPIEVETLELINGATEEQAKNVIVKPKEQITMTQEEKDTLVRDIERNYVNIRSVRRNYASFIPERIEQTNREWLEEEAVFADDLIQYSVRELPVADILRRYESLSDTEREALPIAPRIKSELDSLTADRNKEDEVRSIIEEYFHGERTLGETEDRLVEFFSRSGISPSDANSIMGTASEDIRTGEAPHGTTLFDNVFSTLKRNFAETITRHSSEIARIRAESPELRFDDTERVPEMDEPKRSVAFILRQYVTLDDRTKEELGLAPATRQDLDFLQNVNSRRFELECSIRDAQKDIESVHDAYFKTIFSFEEMEAKRVALEAENPFVERLPEIRVAEILPGYSEWGTLQGTALDIPETVERALDDLLQQTQYSTEILTALQLASSDKEAATKALLAVKDRGSYELSDDFLLRSVDYLSKTLNVGRGFAEEFIRERTPEVASKSNIELPFSGEETDEQNKVIQQNNDTMAQENENTSAPRKRRDASGPGIGHETIVVKPKKEQSRQSNDVVGQGDEMKSEVHFKSPEQALVYAKAMYLPDGTDDERFIRTRYFMEILLTSDIDKLSAIYKHMPEVSLEWKTNFEYVVGQICLVCGEKTVRERIDAFVAGLEKSVKDEPKLMVSYYGSRNIPKDALLVQISTSAPKGMRMDAALRSSYPDFKTMIGPYKDGAIDEKGYIDRYAKQVLEGRRDEILSDVRGLIDRARAEGRDVVFCCYEKPGDFCHRYLLSNFLNENGIACQELPADRMKYSVGKVALYGEDGYVSVAEGKSVLPASTDTDIVFTESRGGYQQRTRENAQHPDVDFTIAFAVDFSTYGEKCTAKAAGDSLIQVNIEKIYDPERDSREVSLMDLARSDAETVFRNLPEEFQNGLPMGVNVAGNGMSTLDVHSNYFTVGETQGILDDYVTAFFAQLQRKGCKFETFRSGGQTGVDEAGAYAGVCLGVPTTVHAPKGFLMRDASGKDQFGKQTFTARFDKKDYASGRKLVKAILSGEFDKSKQVSKKPSKIHKKP